MTEMNILAQMEKSLAEAFASGVEEGAKRARQSSPIGCECTRSEYLRLQKALDTAVALTHNQNALIANLTKENESLEKKIEIQNKMLDVQASYIQDLENILDDNDMNLDDYFTVEDEEGIYPDDDESENVNTVSGLAAMVITKGCPKGCCKYVEHNEDEKECNCSKCGAYCNEK